jgi:hypothetical protein
LGAETVWLKKEGEGAMPLYLVEPGVWIPLTPLCQVMLVSKLGGENPSRAEHPVSEILNLA